MSSAVAIVGSGPAGFYITDALLRSFPGARADIYERLPTPFGLVRGGVAPDHQGTKSVVRQFERTLARPGVRFRGNVEVGRDVTYDELKQAYDVVVVCTGAPIDRKLGIAGEELPGVYGSGAFVGWYNGIPEFRDLEPLLDATAVVIGNGNVALDVVRILAKSPAELAASDLCQHARARLGAARLSDVYMIGRRGPAEASFTTPELRELSDLQRARIIVDANQLADEPPSWLGAEQRAAAAKNLDTLRGFASRWDSNRPLRLHLLFNYAPAAVWGDDRVRGVSLQRTRTDNGRRVATGDLLGIETDALISAIGYRSAPFRGLPFDSARGIVANDGGRVEDGVYACGWCRRGPQGVIPANRSDALAVARLIADDMTNLGHGGGKPGGAHIDSLLAQRRVETIDFSAWQRIDSAERSRAAPGRPREKLTRIAELLAAARP